MRADTLADVIAGKTELSILTALLFGTKLDGALREPGPYTLFAPTDEAFARLRPGSITALRADPPRLLAVLRDHLVPGALVAADLMAVSALTALSGVQLTVTSTHGLRVAQSYLTQADHLAANGVLHQIDAVLLLR
jgi:uncharacterized surface protein with fasciclin (FAS1) repeats